MDFYTGYYRTAMKDINELRDFYPFTKHILIPTVKPGPIELQVIAANKDLIEETNATEDDFIGEYSRMIKVEIPYNYKLHGSKIYGASWLDINKIPKEEWHFNGQKGNDNLFCLGVPKSFSSMKNVILENVKTAESMLIAYTLYLKGETKELELLSYSHGKKGEDEYERRSR